MITQVHYSIVIKNFQYLPNGVYFNLGCRSDYINPDPSVLNGSYEISCNHDDPHNKNLSLMSKISGFRCRYNECQFIRCKNGGKCEIEYLQDHKKSVSIGLNTMKIQFTTKCVCATGFYGKYCDYDFNECELESCVENEDCVNTFGSFLCKCKEGFERVGAQCQSLTPVTTTTVAPKITSPPQISTQSGVATTEFQFLEKILQPSKALTEKIQNCRPGFYKIYRKKSVSNSINFDCIDINECKLPAQNKIFSNSTYIHHAGQNNLTQPELFSPSGCHILTHTCKNHVGSFKCACKKGLKKSKKFPEICVNRDSNCNKFSCKNKGVCVEGSGNNFSCLCDFGYSGKFCENKISERKILRMVSIFCRCLNMAKVPKSSRKP